jgi:hypothetical protein
MGSRSEQSGGKPRPLKAWLSDGEEIGTRSDAAEVDVSSQHHDVILKFGRGTRAEKFSAAQIEQRDIVRPIVASDWQFQVQTPCVTRNV